MIWHTCPCCGVERRPHHEECDVPDACPEEEADWAEMSDLRAEVARLRLTAAERADLQRWIRECRGSSECYERDGVPELAEEWGARACRMTDFLARHGGDK